MPHYRTQPNTQFITKVSPFNDPTKKWKHLDTKHHKCDNNQQLENIKWTLHHTVLPYPHLLAKVIRKKPKEKSTIQTTHKHCFFFDHTPKKKKRNKKKTRLPPTLYDFPGGGGIAATIKYERLPQKFKKTLETHTKNTKRHQSKSIHTTYVCVCQTAHTPFEWIVKNHLTHKHCAQIGYHKNRHNNNNDHNNAKHTTIPFAHNMCRVCLSN